MNYKVSSFFLNLTLPEGYRV